ncbi:MAG: hypothetical protein WBD36_09410 [Bacteroidota bacterium]
MPNNDFLKDYSRFLDSEGRHLTYTALSTYRNSAAQLSEKELEFLTKHLHLCKECRVRLEEIEEVEGEVEDEVEVKDQVKGKQLSPLIRYAIAAVIVVGVGIAVISLLRSPQQNKQQEKSIAFEATSPERFTPNDALENFVSRTTRSANSISIVAPGIGDTLVAPFTFRWEDSRQQRTYTLTVVDNKNNELWSWEGTSKQTSIERTLTPGLYYAKLGANGELSAVTRFVVVGGK